MNFLFYFGYVYSFPIKEKHEFNGFESAETEKRYKVSTFNRIVEIYHCFIYKKRETRSVSKTLYRACVISVVQS